METPQKNSGRLVRFARIPTLVSVLVLFVLAPCARLTAAPGVIEWSNVKQEIDGFGASCAWVSTNQLTDASADAFFSPTNGIGLSLLRTRISPGGPLAPQAFDYAYASPGSIECMQKAIARGATVWSTPWTPKASYKDNNNVNNGGHLLTSNYQAYATELANYVKTLATSNGINLSTLSLQNEPNLATSYESCQYSGQQLHDFLAVLGPTFAANGITATKLMLPETDNCDYSYAAPSLNDTNTAQYVGLIAQHLYQGGPSDYPLARSQGLHIWQTEMSEFSAFDPSMNNGLSLAARMHSCLATYNFNAYHYWWLWAAVSADNNEGLWRNDRTTRTKRFYVMGNYSKFVRPGFVRIAATVNPITAVLVTAYKSPTNGTFAIVVLNNSYAATNVTFTLSGFTATSVTPWLTDATRDLAAQTALPVSVTTFTAALPARSVTTFVGAGATTYSISGTITNAATGAALATVVVSAGTRSATTDVNGAYSFSNVTNGMYTLTPMQSGYTFSPATRQVTVNGADQPGQNFAGVPEPALLLPLLLCSFRFKVERC